jgi:uncharacterized protein
MTHHSAPLANVITLGALDLPRLRGFYTQLDWPLLVDKSDFVAFELRGALLALFPLEKLAADAGVAPEPRLGGLRCSIGLVCDTPDEVSALAGRVRAAGGTVTKEATAESHAGRSCYFADPEGNYWEAVYAPASNAIVTAARRAAGL